MTMFMRIYSRIIRAFPTTLSPSIGNKTINKLDENERNINTLLFGNDQLHLETNKKIFAIVHDFFAPNRPLVNL